VVALRRVQAGQMVKENDLLFRISDPDRLRAELLLPESWLGRVRPGQAARIVPAVGGATLARVSRVSSLVDPASGTFRVTIDVDNRGRQLPSGISARVVLEPTGASR
jgi:membrane fusion protein (multidrug efflux system)